MERRKPIMIGLMICGLVLWGSPTTIAKGKSDHLSTIVKRLLKATKANLTKCKDQDVKRLGLWRFNGDKIPLSEASLKRIYDEVMTRLTRQNRKCLKIIDDQSIGALMTHLSKSGAMERHGGNAISALQEQHQDVNFLIHSEIYGNNDRYTLSMRLVESKSGQVLSQPRPFDIPKRWAEVTDTGPVYLLNKAIKALSAHLTSGAEPIQILETLGVFYQQTNAQPEAGRYLKNKIEAALQRKLSSKMTSKGLRLRGLAILPRDDKSVAARDLNQSQESSTQKVARLSARYWLRDKLVDLRVDLQMPSGNQRVWEGAISRSSFQGLNLEPQNQAIIGQSLPQSSFVFQLTTNRGPAPIYRPGDEIKLLLRSDKNAWVYCFYVTSKQEIIPIVPLVTRKGQMDNRLQANVLMRQPKNLKFQITDDTLGEELITCFATLKDVMTALPPQLFPKPLGTPIALLNLKALRKVFSDLVNVAVAEQTVTATVTKGL